MSTSIRALSFPTPAASRALTLLPDPVRFLGPGSRTLEAIRFALPLLIGGWLVALLLQGVVSPAFYLIGALTALGTALGSDAWLRKRRFSLRRNALALSRYSERTLGHDHELTTRARDDAEALTHCPLARVTRTEERLRYTWELIRALRS